MFKSAVGSTRRLVELSTAYFIFYVITGVAVKYFQGKPELGMPGFSPVEFLMYSTIGSQILCLGVVFIGRWYRFEADRHISFLGIKMPFEFLYIIPSGICTAVVIPTTTLMYSLPISVMVAMVIMRGAVIIISRLVDAIQIKQGILKKKVYADENWAVVFAIAAVSINIFMARKGDFDFIHSVPAMTILGSYILAYMFRIYIMNFYRLTAGAQKKSCNKAFFAVEQLAASIATVIVIVVLFKASLKFGWTNNVIVDFQKTITTPRPDWFWVLLIAGSAYGLVAFFSVFLFMFKGRTATFNGLVNRLTSLVAGTTATLVCCFSLHGKFPKMQDWLSLAMILAAVIFLTRSERKRAAELVKTHEIEAK